MTLVTDTDVSAQLPQPVQRVTPLQAQQAVRTLRHA